MTANNNDFPTKVAEIQPYICKEVFGSYEENSAMDKLFFNDGKKGDDLNKQLKILNAYRDFFADLKSHTYKWDELPSQNKMYFELLDKLTEELNEFSKSNEASTNTDAEKAANTNGINSLAGVVIAIFNFQDIDAYRDSTGESFEQNIKIIKAIDEGVEGKKEFDDLPFVKNAVSSVSEYDERMLFRTINGMNNMYASSKDVSLYNLENLEGPKYESSRERDVNLAKISLKINRIYNREMNKIGDSNISFEDLTNKLMFVDSTGGGMSHIVAFLFALYEGKFYKETNYGKNMVKSTNEDTFNLEHFVNSGKYNPFDKNEALSKVVIEIAKSYSLSIGLVDENLEREKLGQFGANVANNNDFGRGAEGEINSLFAKFLRDHIMNNVIKEVNDDKTAVKSVAKITVTHAKNLGTAKNNIQKAITAFKDSPSEDSFIALCNSCKAGYDSVDAKWKGDVELEIKKVIKENKLDEIIKISSFTSFADAKKSAVAYFLRASEILYSGKIEDSERAQIMKYDIGNLGKVTDGDKNLNILMYIKDAVNKLKKNKIEAMQKAKDKATGGQSEEAVIANAKKNAAALIDDDYSSGKKIKKEIEVGKAMESKIRAEEKKDIKEEMDVFLKLFIDGSIKSSIEGAFEDTNALAKLIEFGGFDLLLQLDRAGFVTDENAYAAMMKAFAQKFTDSTGLAAKIQALKGIPKKFEKLLAEEELKEVEITGDRGKTVDIKGVKVDLIADGLQQRIQDEIENNGEKIYQNSAFSGVKDALKGLTANDILNFTINQYKYPSDNYKTHSQDAKEGIEFLKYAGFIEEGDLLYKVSEVIDDANELIKLIDGRHGQNTNYLAFFLGNTYDKEINHKNELKTFFEKFVSFANKLLEADNQEDVANNIILDMLKEFDGKIDSKKLMKSDEDKFAPVDPDLAQGYKKFVEAIGKCQTKVVNKVKALELISEDQAAEFFSVENCIKELNTIVNTGDDANDVKGAKLIKYICGTKNANGEFVDPIVKPEYLGDLKDALNKHGNTTLKDSIQVAYTASLKADIASETNKATITDIQKTAEIFDKIGITHGLETNTLKSAANNQMNKINEIIKAYNAAEAEGKTAEVTKFKTELDKITALAKAAEAAAKAAAEAGATEEQLTALKDALDGAFFAEVNSKVITQDFVNVLFASKLNDEQESSLVLILKHTSSDGQGVYNTMEAIYKSAIEVDMEAVTKSVAPNKSIAKNVQAIVNELAKLEALQDDLSSSKAFKNAVDLAFEPDNISNNKAFKDVKGYFDGLNSETDTAKYEKIAKYLVAKENLAEHLGAVDKNLKKLKEAGLILETSDLYKANSANKAIGEIAEAFAGNTEIDNVEGLKSLLKALNSLIDTPNLNGDLLNYLIINALNGRTINGELMKVGEGDKLELTSKDSDAKKLYAEVFGKFSKLGSDAIAAITNTGLISQAQADSLYNINNAIATLKGFETQFKETEASDEKKADVQKGAIKFIYGEKLLEESTSILKVGSRLDDLKKALNDTSNAALKAFIKDAYTVSLKLAINDEKATITDIQRIAEIFDKIGITHGLDAAALKPAAKNQIDKLNGIITDYNKAETTDKAAEVTKFKTELDKITALAKAAASGVSDQFTALKNALDGAFFAEVTPKVITQDFVNVLFASKLNAEQESSLVLILKHKLSGQTAEVYNSMKAIYKSAIEVDMEAVTKSVAPNKSIADNVQALVNELAKLEALQGDLSSSTALVDAVGLALKPNNISDNKAFQNVKDYFDGLNSQTDNEVYKKIAKYLVVEENLAQHLEAVDKNLKKLKEAGFIAEDSLLYNAKSANGAICKIAEAFGDNTAIDNAGELKSLLKALNSLIDTPNLNGDLLNHLIIEALDGRTIKKELMKVDEDGKLELIPAGAGMKKLSELMSEVLDGGTIKEGFMEVDEEGNLELTPAGADAKALYDNTFINNIDKLSPDAIKKLGTIGLINSERILEVRGYVAKINEIMDAAGTEAEKGAQLIKYICGKKDGTNAPNIEPTYLISLKEALAKPDNDTLKNSIQAAYTASLTADIASETNKATITDIQKTAEIFNEIGITHGLETNTLKSAANNQMNKINEIITAYKNTAEDGDGAKADKVAEFKAELDKITALAKAAEAAAKAAEAAAEALAKAAAEDEDEADKVAEFKAELDKIAALTKAAEAAGALAKAAVATDAAKATEEQLTALKDALSGVFRDKANNGSLLDDIKKFMADNIEKFNLESIKGALDIIGINVKGILLAGFGTTIEFIADEKEGEILKTLAKSLKNLADGGDESKEIGKKIKDALKAKEESNKVLTIEEEAKINKIKTALSVSSAENIVKLLTSNAADLGALKESIGYLKGQGLIEENQALYKATQNVGGVKELMELIVDSGEIDSIDDLKAFSKNFNTFTTSLKSSRFDDDFIKPALTSLAEQFKGKFNTGSIDLLELTENVEDGDNYAVFGDFARLWETIEGSLQSLFADTGFYDNFSAYLKTAAAATDPNDTFGKEIQSLIFDIYSQYFGKSYKASEIANHAIKALNEQTFINHSFTDLIRSTIKKIDNGADDVGKKETTRQALKNKLIANIPSGNNHEIKTAYSRIFDEAFNLAFDGAIKQNKSGGDKVADGLTFERKLQVSDLDLSADSAIDEFYEYKQLMLALRDVDKILANTVGENDLQDLKTNLKSLEVSLKNLYKMFVKDDLGVNVAALDEGQALKDQLGEINKLFGEIEGLLLKSSPNLEKSSDDIEVLTADGIKKLTEEISSRKNEYEILKASIANDGIDSTDNYFAKYKNIFISQPNNEAQDTTSYFYYLHTPQHLILKHQTIKNEYAKLAEEKRLISDNKEKMTTYFNITQKDGDATLSSLKQVDADELSRDGNVYEENYLKMRKLEESLEKIKTFGAVEGLFKSLSEGKGGIEFNTPLDAEPANFPENSVIGMYEFLLGVLNCEIIGESCTQWNKQNWINNIDAFLKKFVEHIDYKDYSYLASPFCSTSGKIRYIKSNEDKFKGSIQNMIGSKTIENLLEEYKGKDDSLLYGVVEKFKKDIKDRDELKKEIIADYNNLKKNENNIDERIGEVKKKFDANKVAVGSSIDEKMTLDAEELKMEIKNNVDKVSKKIALKFIGKEEENDASVENLLKNANDAMNQRRETVTLKEEAVIHDGTYATLYSLWNLKLLLGKNRVNNIIEAKKVDYEAAFNLSKKLKEILGAIETKPMADASEANLKQFNSIMGEIFNKNFAELATKEAIQGLRSIFKGQNIDLDHQLIAFMELSHFLKNEANIADYAANMHRLSGLFYSTDLVTNADIETKDAKDHSIMKNIRELLKLMHKERVNPFIEKIAGFLVDGSSPFRDIKKKIESSSGKENLLAFVKKKVAAALIKELTDAGVELANTGSVKIANKELFEKEVMDVLKYKGGEVKTFIADKYRTKFDDDVLVKKDAVVKMLTQKLKVCSPDDASIDEKYVLENIINKTIDSHNVSDQDKVLKNPWLDNTGDYIEINPHTLELYIEQVIDFECIPIPE